MTLHLTTINRLLASVLLLSLFSACAPMYPERPISIPPQAPEPQTIPTTPSLPEPAPVPAPAPAPPIAGPAAPLYAEAESALQAGNVPAAEMLLQRALRIEPRNPHYWYALARTASQQGNHRQTVQFCLKAASLAGKDSQLMQRIRALQEHAQRTLHQ
ncbi:MAG: tetratricopeptide repeat protein [Desulfofustis sp.]|nr:tetratricopeptide repeat protein [Desulfofustis sp.]